MHYSMIFQISFKTIEHRELTTIEYNTLNTINSLFPLVKLATLQKKIKNM